MNIHCNQLLIMLPNGDNICLMNSLSMDDFKNYSFESYTGHQGKKNYLVHFYCVNNEDIRVN